MSTWRRWEACRTLDHERSSSNLIYLSIGTGLAAGLILDGRIHRGHRGAAGEIGHLPVGGCDDLCQCGLRGCLETVASGTAILKSHGNSQGTAQNLVAAANSGDECAIASLTELVDYIAYAVYALTIAVDVETVVIGGGAGAVLHDQIAAACLRFGEQSKFVSSLALADRLAAKPSGPVEAVGAAFLASTGLLADEN